jgi:RNA 3'-terminal phosphate cyclase (ATP)
MLIIDGSYGEGGGQILRTSLALSLVTRTPFRIERLRAGRAKPGLMRQHLTAVQAAVEIGAAKVHGAEVGSQVLELHPRDTRPGDYRFSVGTAGSATLVLQTVLPALLLARAPSALVLEGGTHNPLAPTFDFLERVFLPLLRRMGVDVTARLDRPGFYPAGGGRFSVSIEPAATLTPLHLLERGELRARRATAMFAALPFDIARRELDTVRAQLGWDAAWCRPLEVESAGPGNVVQIELESAHVTELFSGFGERGRPAEAVAEGVAGEAAEYLEADVPVGRHLADQLLLPLALAKSGSFRSLSPTPHTRTQIEIIRRFLGTSFRCEEIAPGRWHFEVA